MIEKEHVCIFGATSSGKTVFATKMFEGMGNFNVFINTQYEPYVARCGVVVSTVNGFCEAIEQKQKHIVFASASEDIDTQKEEISEIIDILFTLGKLINNDGKRRIWCHVYVDEVHLYSNKKAPFAKLDRIATQGKRHGVVGVFISQRPALVSQTLITQSTYQVIYRCGSYEIPYFERYGYPITEYKDWLDKPYHFILDDSKDIIRMNPIKY